MSKKKGIELKETALENHINSLFTVTNTVFNTIFK